MNFFVEISNGNVSLFRSRWSYIKSKDIFGICGKKHIRKCNLQHNRNISEKFYLQKSPH